MEQQRQQAGRIMQPLEFDIDRHQTWLDYRAWFEYREERDRASDVKTQKRSTAAD